MKNENIIKFLTYFTTNSRDDIIYDFSKFIDIDLNLDDDKDMLLEKFIGTIVVKREQDK